MSIDYTNWRAEALGHLVMMSADAVEHTSIDFKTHFIAGLSPIEAANKIAEQDGYSVEPRDLVFDPKLIRDSRSVE